MQLKDLGRSVATGDPRLQARNAFLSGVKAAFVVSQLNRLGQVLCGRCGRSWSRAETAFDELTLANVLGEREEPGYDVHLGWGIDNPNNLKLCCTGCRDAGGA